MNILDYGVVCYSSGQWTLPDELEGIHVDRAVELQCQMLYRHWRYRLKELHFAGKTVVQALANTPPEVDKDKWEWLVNFWTDPKQQQISEKNRSNRLTQTIKPANGAKSTARIYHDEIIPSTIPQESVDEIPQESVVEIEQDPPYAMLYGKCKRHRNGGFDPDAEINYEKFKKFHAEQIEKHGVNNVNVVDAYAAVLKNKKGYPTGLGAGPSTKRQRPTAASTDTVRLQQANQIQDLQQREAELRGTVGRLESSNAELTSLVTQLREEAKQKEQDLENRLRAELMKMIKHGPPYHM